MSTTITNERRAEWARTAVTAYAAVKGEEVDTSTAPDLLTDLLHHIARADGAPRTEEEVMDEVTSALRHWLHEHRVGGEPVSENPRVDISFAPPE